MKTRVPFQHLPWHESERLIVILAIRIFISTAGGPWLAVNGWHFLGVFSLS